MKFITYNDSPGGVYKSQVTDVCRFLSRSFGNIPVELMAFVSLRTYFSDRKKIKKLYKNSTVLPSVPGLENWRKNRQILNIFMLFRKRDTVITRGVFATLIALDSGKFSAVCFDSRTAYAAEWKEYLSKESPGIAAEMNSLEKEALFRSDFRMAVSEQLVGYWKENYGYHENNHVVIPCTIDSTVESALTLQAPPDSTTELRSQLGITDTDILLVFSGSSAGWQSMEGLYQILESAFVENPSLKLLLLSKDTIENAFSKLFPGRVISKWVEPEKVSNYLKTADYGLLFREDSVTNRVSSPVKFAEYLAAGLPVIISNNVGDYNSFVREKNCGFLFNSFNWGSLKRPSQQEKTRMQEIALTHLTKSAYLERYKKAIQMK